MTHALGGFALLNVGLPVGPDTCPAAERSAEVCVPVLSDARFHCAVASTCRPLCPPVGAAVPSQGTPLGLQCVHLPHAVPGEARAPPPRWGWNCPKCS